MDSGPELFLELARLIGTESQHHTDVEDYDSFQYLRLPAAHLGELSLKRIEDLCQKANESQCFYRSISLKQWLRTVIKKEQEKADPIMHSNVVPRKAYLDAACRDLQQCRGFVPANELTDGLAIFSPRSCKNCALAEQMRIEIDGMAIDQLHTLLPMEEVEDMHDLAPGTISKILWRNGIFLRKRFSCEENFVREVDVVTKVSHPNIVHCFGCFLWPNSTDCDLFMELLDVDLQMLFNEEGEGSGSPFSFQDSLNVLLQIAEAMKHLHEMNFLHGDLKPQNIFMSRFELAHSGVPYYLVKVGDFGCAQRVDSSGATVKPFCSSIGTVRYTAPEVLRCRKHRAAPPKHPQKTDVYSFGAVAYQVLTGVADFYKGLRNSKIIELVIDGRLRPDTHSSGVLHGDSLSLLPLIQDCLNPNPEARPSFAEICEKLLSTDVENDHGLCETNAKRKHHSIGEVFMKPMKAFCFGNKDSVGTW